jgi:hypothetical protein
MRKSFVSEVECEPNRVPICWWDCWTSHSQTIVYNQLSSVQDCADRKRTIATELVDRLELTSSEFPLMMSKIRFRSVLSLCYETRIGLASVGSGKRRRLPREHWSR